MTTTTIRIRNRGTEIDPVYEGVEDGTNARMDGERRDLGGRSLAGWYPGIADYVREAYGVTEDLTFPASLDGEPDTTTFEGRTAEVTVHDLRDHRVMSTAWPSAAELEELSIEEMTTVLRTILERGRHGWTMDEQAGPFNELLRKLIAKGRLEAASDACHLYFTGAPQARRGVLRWLPGMVLNGYPPFASHHRRPGPSLLGWLRPEMAEDIRRSVTKPDFRAVVDGLVAQLPSRAA